MVLGEASEVTVHGGTVRWRTETETETKKEMEMEWCYGSGEGDEARRQCAVQRR